MNRKLKALGLAASAALMVMAISASIASAVDFHSETATHTVIKGSQVGTDVFTVNAGTEACKELTYEGIHTGATATTVTVTPKWSGCTAFGFINATIDVNGCTYVFSGDNFNMKIACPEGKSIVKTAFNCWVTIPSQETASGITYTNTGAGATRDIDISQNITGIKYTQHSKSFPGCTNGTFSNGTYKGAATFQGFNTEGKQIAIWRA